MRNCMTLPLQLRVFNGKENVILHLLDSLTNDSEALEITGKKNPKVYFPTRHRYCSRALGQLKKHLISRCWPAGPACITQ